MTKGGDYTGTLPSTAGGAIRYAYRPCLTLESNLLAFFRADVGVDKRDVGEIESRLRSAKVGTWRLVPKEEALKRMQSTEGMAEIIASLPRNPLPDAFIVEPTDTTVLTTLGAALGWLGAQISVSLHLHRIG